MRAALALPLVAPLTAATFANPVLPLAPDPAIIVDGGRYLATWTAGDRIVLRAARTLGGLAEAPDHVVLRSDGIGAAAHDWWAPELHRIGGRWWLYWCATPGGDSGRRLFVAGCRGDDPLRDPWEAPRRLVTPIAGYAIDPTVFTVGDRAYLAWSAKIASETGAWQHLCLAPLEAPDRVGMPGAVIAAPDQPWERSAQPTVEGPAVLVRDGTVYLTYSASAFWSDDYCVGLLTADADADLLDPRAWRKHAQPLFASAGDAFGPGHHSFFRSPDGREDWLVYHARSAPGQPMWPERRAARAQPLSWAGKLPSFGLPAALSALLREPSGTKP